VSPAAITYWNIRVALPEPLLYVAARGVFPNFRDNEGTPDTVTVSENATLTSISEPSPYVPAARGEPTPVTFASLQSEFLVVVHSDLNP